MVRRVDETGELLYSDKKQCIQNKECYYFNIFMFFTRRNSTPNWYYYHIYEDATISFYFHFLSNRISIDITYNLR